MTNGGWDRMGYGGWWGTCKEHTARQEAGGVGEGHRTCAWKRGVYAEVGGVLVEWGVGIKGMVE